jgi:hypothetical protein
LTEQIKLISQIFVNPISGETYALGNGGEETLNSVKEHLFTIDEQRREVPPYTLPDEFYLAKIWGIGWKEY